MTDHSQMALGRKPRVLHDLRTARLADFVEKRALPSLPRTTVMGYRMAFDMLGNDAYGDCGFAGKAHLDHAISRTRSEPPANDVVQAYLAFTQEYYGGGDTGVYLLDVLNDWTRRDDSASNRAEAYAAVDLDDRRLLHAAAWIFGGLYIGIALPITAQRQKVWDTVAGVHYGDAMPNSWGGHCVYVTASWGADRQGFTCVTWGQRQKMTWNFWRAYVDEAYVVLHPDWLARHKGRAPNGFDHAALIRYLSEVRE